MQIIIAMKLRVEEIKGSRNESKRDHSFYYKLLVVAIIYYKCKAHQQPTAGGSS